jgi:hypothetical protein
MKGYLFLLCFALFSCGDKPQTDDASDQGIDSDYEYDNTSYQDLNLTKEGLGIIMRIPEQTGGETGNLEMKVNKPVSNCWLVEYGPSFGFEIIDYGKLEDLIVDKKKELIDNDFFKIEFLEDNDSMLVYNQKVNYRNKTYNEESVDKSSFHVYRLKIIDGYNYIFKSTEDGCTKDDLKSLEVSFNSIQKPING